MIIDEHFYEIGKILNLNNYELKAWIALISKKKSTIKEISSISNLPKSRVYDVMESLCKKGLAIESLDKQKSYVAIPPKDVFSQHKKKIEKQKALRRERIEKVKDEDFFRELKKLEKNEEKTLEEPDVHFKGPLHMDKVKRETLMSKKIEIFGPLEHIRIFLRHIKPVDKEIIVYTYSSKEPIDLPYEIHFIKERIEGVCLDDSKLYLKIYDTPDQTIEVDSMFFASTLKNLIKLNKL